MGRTSGVYFLPPTVREDLIRRIVHAGDGNYVALEEWLAEQGHVVSKSALHRFGKELKGKQGDIQLAELAKATENSEHLSELRMRCLEASIASGADDAIATAQTFLDWVLEPA